MTAIYSIVSGVLQHRFRGITASFPPPFRDITASFQGYLVKDIKDLKVFISRGNAGFMTGLSPLTG